MSQGEIEMSQLKRTQNAARGIFLIKSDSTRSSPVSLSLSLFPCVRAESEQHAALARAAAPLSRFVIRLLATE